MLKKLRLRFVCVLMAIVTVTLCLMFGLVYHFTRENLESQALSMMESVVEDPLQLGRPNSRSQEMKLPYFLIKVSAHGELVAVSGGYYDLSDETFLKDLILRVSEAGTDSGMIPEYNLRYLLTRNYASSTLVFADMSSEKTTLKTLATAFAGIGLVCLLAFLAIAELLARWMIRPAEKAWSQQRQFVSDASHELKTPLTVILTNAELMQMTEETFIWLRSKIAPDEGLTFDELYDPDVSIRFGCYYIHLCMERYGGDVATAAAAYHSGWGTVDNLLRMEEHSSDGQTLKGFPYNQMHHYVEKITASYAVYTRLYGG